MQQGQVFKLKKRAVNGRPVCGACRDQRLHLSRRPLCGELVDAASDAAKAMIAAERIGGEDAFHR